MRGGIVGYVIGAQLMRQRTADSATAAACSVLAMMIAAGAARAEVTLGPSPQVLLDVKFVEVTTDFVQQIGFDTPSRGYKLEVGASSLDALNTGVAGAPMPGGATETLRSSVSVTPLVGQVPSIGALFRNKAAANPSNLPVDFDNIFSGSGSRAVIPMTVTPRVSSSGQIQINLDISATITKPTNATLDDGGGAVQFSLQVYNVDDPQNPAMLLDLFSSAQFGFGSGAMGSGVFENHVTPVNENMVMIDVDETIPVGVPALSKIAVVGTFFTGVQARRNQSDLIVFLTPYIVDAENTAIMTISSADSDLLVAPEPGALWAVLIIGAAAGLRSRASRDRIGRSGGCPVASPSARACRRRAC